MTEFVDLVTDSGELINIECPDKHIDEFYVSIENAMKRGDWWSPSRFEGCKAEYLGMLVSRVSMKKIIGIL